MAFPSRSLRLLVFGFPGVRGVLGSAEAGGVGVPSIVPGVSVPGVWTTPPTADGRPGFCGGRLIDMGRP